MCLPSVQVHINIMLQPSNNHIYPTLVKQFVVTVLRFVCLRPALEVLCTKKDEELASKEMEIGKLKQRMKGSEEAHRRELEELNIRMQQEVYMAKKLNRTELKRSSRYK